MERQRGCKSQMSLYKHSGTEKCFIQLCMIYTQIQMILVLIYWRSPSDFNVNSLSYHYDGLVLSGLHQCSRHLYRLPREHQVFDVLIIQWTTTPILILSMIYKNLRSQKSFPDFIFLSWQIQFWVVLLYLACLVSQRHWFGSLGDDAKTFRNKKSWIWNVGMSCGFSSGTGPKHKTSLLISQWYRGMAGVWACTHVHAA